MAEQRTGHGKVRWVILIVVIALVGFGIWKWRSSSDQAIAQADAVTERHLTTGKVVGFVEGNGSHAWLGIPYAKPPVGSLRWKAPQPLVKQNPSLTAIRAGGFCPQIGNASISVDDDQLGKPVGSEDCLYLNIWAPARSGAEIKQQNPRLPVMFWIHGGGNSIGHGVNYSGKMLAAEQNLVVVTINYRLGPLGWFAHPALQAAADSPLDRSGNFGTLDIQQALSWVRGNIASFGGDPDNITVFGESAGAFNTVSMLLSPRAKGLFHRAIIQSGGVRMASMSRAGNYRDDAVPGDGFSAREVTNLLLVADGKAKNRDAAKQLQQNMSNAELETYLRSKKPSDLLSVYKQFGFGMLGFPNLIKDGQVLPAGNALDRFADSTQYNAVPVIIGSNRDEFKLFMAFNPQYADSYLKMIFRVKDKALYAATAAYLSDAWKASGVDAVAAQLSKTPGSGVFAYRFDWDEEPSILGSDFSFLLGAAHMLEVPFVFRNKYVASGMDRMFTEDNESGWQSLSSAMGSYWAEFAYSGNPGKGRKGQLPVWNNWRTDNGSYLVLDTPGDKGIRMTNRKVTMDQLKPRLLAETAIKDQNSLCELYFTLFGDPTQFISDTSLWNDHEFLNLGSEGCSSYSRQDL